MLSDVLAFGYSPGPAPKQRRVVEEGAPSTAAPDKAESSRRTGGMGSQPSEEIPVGEPIISPYNGSNVLPVTRLLHADKTAGSRQKLKRRRSRVTAFWRKLQHPLLALSVIMVNILKMIRS